MVDPASMCGTDKSANQATLHTNTQTNSRQDILPSTLAKNLANDTDVVPGWGLDIPPCLAERGEKGASARQYIF